MSTWNIKFTNNSGIAIYAHSPSPASGIDVTTSTIPDGSINLPIATVSAPYGWINLGKDPSENAYQIYFECTSYLAKFGHYAANRTQSNPDPLPFSATTVGSGIYPGTTNFNYTFNGKKIEHTLRLNEQQIWEHELTETWAALAQHTCTLDIDQETTGVVLKISNNCGSNFFLFVKQAPDGNPSWDSMVRNGASWKHEFAVNMVANATWEFNITGTYGDLSGSGPGLPPLGPIKPLPDPTFKIKRKGS